VGLHNPRTQEDLPLDGPAGPSAFPLGDVRVLPP